MALIRIKNIAVGIALSILVAGCSTWSNTSIGSFLGTIGGAIVGAGVGGALGDEEGADLGAHIGSTLGYVAGGAIGAEADAKKAEKQYKAQQQAESYYFVDEKTGKRYKRISRNNDIIFSSRSSELDAESVSALREIARDLKKTKGDIYIYGSTDDIESRGYSMQLSEERAKVVAGFLSVMKVDQSRMKIVPLGDSSPLADNSTMDGRTRNRCVEIYVEIK